MVFVIGGKYQGMRAFAEQTFPKGRILPDYQDRVRQCLLEGRDPLMEARALLENASAAKLEHPMGGMLQTAEDLPGAIEETGGPLPPKEDGELIILSTEVGCGVVPMEREERRYRELNGRVNCYFAAHAREVYRLIAGIPQRIK